MNSHIELKKHHRFKRVHPKDDIYESFQGNADDESEMSAASKAFYIVSLFLVAIFFSAVLFGINTDCPNTANYVYCAPNV